VNDPKPAIHFMFPAHNLAVPVCPGDIIIFNPALYHGCSAKLAAFDDADVNLMSMYLKAAVVGGNDNKIPVPLAVEEAMAKVWAEKDGKKSDSPEKEEEAGHEEPPLSRKKARPKAVQWNVLTRSKAAAAAAMESKSDDEEEGDDGECP
jgi:ectoine hydroxylase-related dioxygenase (phytanoyl-CoA dioxygenase family)